MLQLVIDKKQAKVERVQQHNRASLVAYNR
jgi:hypothetical protein